jgi:hypothetical protein
MDLFNLFNYCNNSLSIKNTLLKVTDLDCISIILSFEFNTNLINLYSDEWLYLINYNYPNGYYYQNYITEINNFICNKFIQPKIEIKEDVLQFFTTFSRGAVHGFSGFFNNLVIYLNNYELYKELKILILKDSDSGIIDIINYLVYKEILDYKKIIFIEKNTTYLFDSVTYIKNEYHVFNNNFIPLVDEFINKYLIFSKNIIMNYPTNVCIVKTDKTKNSTVLSNIFNNEDLLKFCNKYDYTNISHNLEIDKINKIYNCKYFIVSYGSAFFKNFIYISNKCEKIIVLVNGEYYKNDYKHLKSIIPNKYQGLILDNYKNANIIYLLRDNLDFNPNDI